MNIKLELRLLCLIPYSTHYCVSIPRSLKTDHTFRFLSALGQCHKDVFPWKGQDQHIVNRYFNDPRLSQ
jgi:hypothetical protein